MPDPDPLPSLEQQIDQWKSSRHRQRADPADTVALEGTLREQVAMLTSAGLADDEAFFIALKRIGEQDASAQDFAREYSGRLLKTRTVSAEPRMRATREAIVAFSLAVAAAAAIKLPALFGMEMQHDSEFYARNVSLLVLPLLTAYFVWKRRLATGTLAWLAAAFVAAAVFANVYPLTPRGSTEVLSALHLPIALWLVVGIAYAGGRWRESASRMDFVRFSGELFIDYILIALGGVVFTAFMTMLFKALGIKVDTFVELWLLPCGAAGAVLVASWLVEARQRVMEAMAPMLTRLFTPLFAAMLLAFLGAVAWTGRGVGIERHVLIAFDLVLVVVLGLHLYSVSARDPEAPPGAFDVAGVVLVISALLADAVALQAIASRISELGLTPNRVAALGENAILLVNLAWSAVLYLRFLTGRGSFTRLERWQTNYLPVYAVWAAIVVVVFPPLFRYV